MRASLFALAGSAASAMAAVRGFNYASQSQTYETFESQFNIAKSLAGADDFSSARLYTMIQDGTSNTVISAIPAAIATKTTLLLGLWASVNQAAFENELTALKNAIDQYGSEFADLVTGISVGSEDLYRNSPTGIAAGSGYGQEPDVIVDYIGQVRDAISGTVLSGKLVGHVDTWNDFVNGSNSAVVAAADFLGLDEYPYYQTTDANSIENAGDLFFEAYDKVAAVAGSKPIWITEAGWPTSGPASGDAVASTENAASFWQQVACELESRSIDFWWYILADAGASPSFGVSSNGTPLYDLSCSATNSSSSSSASSSASSTAASTSVAQATSPLSASASTTVSVGTPVPTGNAAVGSGSAVGTGASASQGIVYVTGVTTSFVTTCPAGQTITTDGSTIVLTTESVFTTASVMTATITGAVPVGTGASASNGMPGASGASTLASTWGANQTPSGTGVATYTGAASKMDGSMAALALGVAAVLAM